MKINCEKETSLDMYTRLAMFERGDCAGAVKRGV